MFVHSPTFQISKNYNKRIFSQNYNTKGPPIDKKIALVGN